MNLLRYSVAMSLDGFIARANGEYDWLPPDPGVDFAALFDQFDRFVMGRKTFEIVKAEGEQSMVKDPVLVVSRTLSDPGIPGVEVIRENIVDRVRQFKAEAKKDVWLFGGGELFRFLLDADLVDRVEVAVIPILLGAGIPLVAAGATHSLKFEHSNILSNGIVQLEYAVSA